MLVATKVGNFSFSKISVDIGYLKVEDPSSCQEVLDKILSLAKGQLISVSSKSFLVDKIL